MGKRYFKLKNILYFAGIAFLIIAIDFLLNINFWPERLTTNNPVPTVLNYYRVAVPHHMLKNLLALNWHILAGMTMLVLGLFQLNQKFHIKHRRLHRAFGLAYFVAGVLAAGMGLVLSADVLGGLITRMATLTFAALWFFSAYKTVFFALAKNVQLHRRWAIRNYFATVATGLIRPAMLIVDLLVPNQPADVLFPIANWLGVVASLLLSQWYIERSEAKTAERTVSGSKATQNSKVAS